VRVACSQLGLWGFNPMPVIIWVAIIIEIGLQNWPDVGVLVAIQFINATLGW
jgi:H+-transporting ATPase